MADTSLRYHLLNGGVKGKVFLGTVGGKNREYTPVDFNFIRYKNHDDYEPSILVNLVGEDIPKKIIRRRKEGTFPFEYFDYVIRLGEHMSDPYVRDLRKR